jgi:hypothetical protein
MNDPELDDLLAGLQQRRANEEKENKRRQAERALPQRLREECERVASFCQDRLLVGPGRMPDEGDLFDQWSWEWRALYTWLTRAGLVERLKALEAGDDLALANALAWLRKAPRPGGLEDLARCMKKAAKTPALLASILKAIRELPDRLFTPQTEGLPPSQPTASQVSESVGVVGSAVIARDRESKPIPEDEANLLVRKYLEQHPEATARQVAQAVGIALGRVPKLPAWRTELGRRKAKKASPKRATRPLTQKMLEVVGRKDDPVARIEAEEAAWQWLLEQAGPDERAKLHAMTTAERRRLIEIALEQHADDCS